VIVPVPLARPAMKSHTKHLAFNVPARMGFV
jgi:hypothetical protein